MIRTRRWNDPVDKGDGTRVLVCRYRPRGVRKEDETWDEWAPDLGPSKALHRDYWDGKLDWSAYQERYLEEMRAPKPSYFIRALAQRVGGGEKVTLLCSSACSDENKCHRTLLKALIESEKAATPPRR